MQVKNVKSDGLSHELEITIPANDIDARVEARLVEVSATTSEPGFRKGKVPLARMKQKYGKAIMGEVLEAAVNETSQEALENAKLQPAMQPKIEVKSFDEGEDLVYTVSVEVLPEFKITDLKKLKLEKPVAKPEKKNIDEALGKIASQNVSSKKIEGDRKTKDGDTVLMDFDGRTADDNVKQDGMAAEGHKLKLGSNQFIPGFEEQLVGHKAGDKVEVKVAFPENYGAEDLAGRDAIFDVQIHEIHEDAEAQIDDEFAKTLGMDDVAALEKAVGEQIQKEFDNYSRMRAKKNLLDVLDKEHDFDVPPGMLEMEYDSIIKQIEQEQAQQNPGETVEVSDEDKEEFKTIAVRRVKLGLVLSEIGRENNIEVSQADLQKAVIEQAQKYPGQEKEVFDFYSKNQDALNSLRAPLFEEKTVDFIFELATVTEVEMSPEDLTKDDDEEDAPKAKKPAAKKKAPAKKKAAAKKDD
jgi:trigger factor